MAPSASHSSGTSMNSGIATMLSCHVAKQGDLGRDRQRWCRESSLNLATDVWLSFVSRKQGARVDKLNLIL
jgi:hypothetical protein